MREKSPYLDVKQEVLITYHIKDIHVHVAHMVSIPETFSVLTGSSVSALDSHSHTRMHGKWEGLGNTVNKYFVICEFLKVVDTISK